MPAHVSCFTRNATKWFITNPRAMTLAAPRKNTLQDSWPHRAAEPGTQLNDPVPWYPECTGYYVCAIQKGKLYAVLYPLL